MFFSGIDLDFSCIPTYSREVVPSKKDGELTDVIEKWLQLDTSRRYEASAEIISKQYFIFLVYSARIAGRAVFMKSEELVFQAIIAAGIDGWKNDYRDNLTSLAICLDAANQITDCPDALFEKAATFMQERVARGLFEFVHRPADQLELNRWGYERVVDGLACRYVHRGLPPVPKR